MLWYVVFTLLAAILFWRLVWPNLKQASGGTGVTPPVAAGAGTPSATPLAPTSVKGWFVEYLWSILLVLGGAILIYWASKTQVQPGDVGSWGWNHLLPLLIFWGISAALIALNAKALGVAAKTLQWVLAGGMLMLFIVFPIGSWVRELSLPKVTCPDASAASTLSCVINTSWTAPLKPASEPGLVGKHLCSTPEKPAIESERIVNKGGAFWIFRAAEGHVLLRYRFMNECPQHELPS